MTQFQLSIHSIAQFLFLSNIAWYYLWRAIQNKNPRNAYLRRSAPLRDNARPHTATRTKSLMSYLTISLIGKFSIIFHPQFRFNTEWLSSFLKDEIVDRITNVFHRREFKNGINQWVETLTMPFFREAMEKILDHVTKNALNYVEN